MKTAKSRAPVGVLRGDGHLHFNILHLEIVVVCVRTDLYSRAQIAPTSAHILTRACKYAHKEFYSHRQMLTRLSNFWVCYQMGNHIDGRSRVAHAQLVRCADVSTTRSRREKPSGRPRPLAAAAYSVCYDSHPVGRGKACQTEGEPGNHKSKCLTRGQQPYQRVYIEAELCEAGGVVRPSIPLEWDGHLCWGRGGRTQVGVAG